jgi:uncharacterized membrane protein YbhN (UPF0104 family)
MTAERVGIPWARLLRIAAVTVVVVFVVVFVVTNWAEVRAGLLRLQPSDVLVALAAAMLGVVASMLSWRALVTGAGSPLRVTAAARVFFLGQLGKYVPGSVWPIVAQMELSQRYEVPRARTAFAALTQMLVGIVTGIVVAAVLLALSPTGALAEYRWLTVVGVVSMIALLPPVLNVGVGLAARLTGGRLTAPEPLGWRTVGTSAAWALVMWVAFGVHTWVMAARLGPPDADLWLLATGGYALASVVGIVIIVLPAGAGAREAILVLVFSGVLSSEDAIVLALVSRFIMLVADLAGAGVAVAVTRRDRGRLTLPEADAST